jgi:hypothetical protein
VKAHQRARYLVLSSGVVISRKPPSTGRTS